MFTRTGKILLLLAFLALLAGCGTNSLTDTQNTQHGKFSNIPTGKGNQPEQGTDGKPKPSPNGHWESILVTNGITYAGSDNGHSLLKNSTDEFTYKEKRLHSLLLPLKQQSAQTDVLRG